MKIALLFSGQIRNLPFDIFQKSLSNLTREIDYEIYSYSWYETGKSLNHSKHPTEIDNLNNAPKLVKELFKNFNLKVANFESFLEFEKNLLPEYKKIYKSERFHSGTVNSMPQIYALSKCFKLVSENLNNFDLIFKCRFDSMYVHPLKVYNLERIKYSNKLYNINFGRSFYPKRVYDIFFGGSVKSMFFLNTIWEELPNLVNDEFNNNLDKMDACRLFYLGAYKQKINVVSFETRICDIFRNFKNNYYEKYLISMHLIRLKNCLINIESIGYFLNWFSYRKMRNSRIIFLIIISFFITPFSYLKRFKYIKYFNIF